MRFDEIPPLTLDQIKSTVADALGPVHPNSLEFRAGVVLLTILRDPKWSTDPVQISEFTGYSLKRNLLQSIITRIREFGIVRTDLEGTTFRAEWLDEANGTNSPDIAFVMDCMTVAGYFNRFDRDGDLYYSLTEKGNSRVPA